MKKILAITVFILCWHFSKAQVWNRNDTTKYVWYKYQYGSRMPRAMYDSVFAPPRDTVYSKNGLATKNNLLYVGNGNYWTEISGSGSTVVAYVRDPLKSDLLGVDTTVQYIRQSFLDSVRHGVDSIYVTADSLYEVVKYKDGHLDSIAYTGGGGDTTSLSNRINLKVDSVVKRGDTLRYFVNGDSTFIGLLAGGGSGWGLTGNSGTDPTVNFIGTTDKDTLIFKVNNNQTIRLDNSLYNYSIGNSSLGNITTGERNISLGLGSMFFNSTGSNNTSIGRFSQRFNNSGTYNTSIGDESLFAMTDSIENTAIGVRSLFTAAGSGNTGIGAYTNTIGDNVRHSTAIGYAAQVGTSYSIVLGDTSVIKVGIGINYPIARLHVVGDGTTSAIFNNGNVGIGTSIPGAKLHVVGGFKYVDGNQGNGKILMSDANGAATWQAQSPFGLGTVTLVNTAYPVTGGPITTIGTVGVDTTTSATALATQGFVARQGYITGNQPLTLGYGLTGTSYNGAAAVTTKVDTSINVLNPATQGFVLRNSGALGFVSAVTASVPLASSGGQTPNISADTSGGVLSAVHLATQGFVTRQGYGTGNGTVTSVTAGLNLTGGTITGSGTLGADTTIGATKLATQGFVTRSIPTVTAGTVTLINTSAPVLGGPITTTGTISVDTSGGALSALHLATQGFVTRQGYLTGNQTISFAPTGDVTGSTTGTTTLAPALTIGALKVTNGMLAGSITSAKLVGTDITAVGTLTGLTVAGNITLTTAGNKLSIAEGVGGRVGQTTLVLGTIAVAITGLTTSSRAFVQLVTPTGTIGVGYKAVCTANLLTITALTSLAATQVLDLSTLNYFILN